MKPTKIIFTSHTQITKILIKNLNLKEQTGVYIGEQDQYKIILLNSNTYTDLEKTIEEEIEINKIISIEISQESTDIDLKSGDVILPNTFFGKNNNAIFLDYATSGNFDFNKFGLLLNGVCSQQLQEGDEEHEFQVDIVDKDIFNTLKNLENKNLQDKAIIIRGIGDTDESIENSTNILELVL